MIINAYALPGLKEFDSNILIADVTIERIIELVSKYFRVNEQKVKSPIRERNATTARKWCMYFMRVKTSLSLIQIAAYFANRHHSTVIYSIEFVSKQLRAKGGNAYKDDYERLIQII